jgi:hypothetical protein
MAPKILRPEFMRVGLKKDVLPIVGVVAFATIWMVYKSVQHMNAPDVFWNPARRSAGVEDGKFSVAEGHEWQKRVATHYRHKDQRVGDIGIFEPFTADYWAKRREVTSTPATATRGGAVIADMK